MQKAIQSLGLVTFSWIQKQVTLFIILMARKFKLAHSYQPQTTYFALGIFICPF